MVNAGGCGRGSFEASLTLSFTLLVIVFRCAVRRQDYLRSPARSRSGPAEEDTYLVASNVSSQPLCSEDGWKLPWHRMDTRPHSRRARFRAVLPLCR